VVANDSSLLIDGNTGKFNLSGSVGTDIIPDADIFYDLGSPTFRFRDLYLSGSSIKLGAATITATGTAVNLPAGSTIGGSEIGIPGGDLNVNIVADDSTVIVNTTTEVVTAQGGFVGNVTGNTAGTHTGAVIGNVTGNVNGIVTGTAGSSLVGNVTGNVNGIVTGTAGSSLVGNVTGNITGDVKGSLYGDDSSLIIDANSNEINIRNISHTSGFINIGTDTTPLTAEMVSNSNTEMLNVRGITTGSFGSFPFLNIRTSKGTPATPTTTAAGDILNGLSFQGYANGDYQSAGTIFVNWESGATLTNANPASKITFATGDDAGGVNLMTFDRYGTVKAPVFNLTSYASDAARSTAIPTPAAGMMVFMASGTSPAVTNKAVVYDGTAWVALH
jgi:hypothetical protein